MSVSSCRSASTWSRPVASGSVAAGLGGLINLSIDGQQLWELGWIELQLRPRWPGWTSSRSRLRLHAAMVGFCGFLLLLPLVGMPFTNTLPALVIVIGMLGMMERDGVALAAAYGLLVVTLAYLGMFATVLVELFERCRHWLAGGW